MKVRRPASSCVLVGLLGVLGTMMSSGAAGAFDLASTSYEVVPTAELRLSGLEEYEVVDAGDRVLVDSEFESSFFLKTTLSFSVAQ